MLKQEYCTSTLLSLGDCLLGNQISYDTENGGEIRIETIANFKDNKAEARAIARLINRHLAEFLDIKSKLED